MKLYQATDEEIRILERIRVRLYSGFPLDADQMRNMAQAIEGVVSTMKSMEVPTKEG